MNSRFTAAAHDAGVRGLLRTFLTISLLAVAGGVAAQTNDDKGTFTVRELGASTGYAFVQLPPITLGGQLPDGVIKADVITTGSAIVDWRRITARTRYRLDAFGTYTARAHYSRLNAPGADLQFSVTRLFGYRWRLGLNTAAVLTSSDRLAYRSAQRSTGTALLSFEDLAGAAALPRSPHPDPEQAALFVPISTSIAASELRGDRMFASTLKAEASYAHSPRLATSIRGGYTIARPTSSQQQGASLPTPDSRTASVGLDIRYDTSERTQLTTAFGWSHTTGVSGSQALSATVGYGWYGRKWLASATIGASPTIAESGGSAPADQEGRAFPPIVLSGAVGYRFQTQTLLAEYSRTTHDEYGYAGRNAAAGFEGYVQSVGGSWSWSSPRSRWLTRSQISFVRRPGNFSYINAWLSTTSVGRTLSPQVRVLAELTVDRHGSRAFEGFHQSTQSLRFNLIWSRPRRPVDRDPLE